MKDLIRIKVITRGDIAYPDITTAVAEASCAIMEASGIMTC